MQGGEDIYICNLKVVINVNKGEIYGFRMRVYEFKREKRLEEILELLKGMIADGNPIKQKDVITAISVRYNVSRKTAGDYFMAAQFKLKAAATW